MPMRVVDLRARPAPVTVSKNSCTPLGLRTLSVRTDPEPQADDDRAGDERAEDRVDVPGDAEDVPLDVIADFDVDRLGTVRS